MSTKEPKLSSHLPAASTGRTGRNLARSHGLRAYAGGPRNASLAAALGGEAKQGIFEVQVNGVMEIFAL